MLTSDRLQSFVLSACLPSHQPAFFCPVSAWILILHFLPLNCARSLYPNSAVSVGAGDHSSTQTGGTKIVYTNIRIGPSFNLLSHKTTRFLLLWMYRSLHRNFPLCFIIVKYFNTNVKYFESITSPKQKKSICQKVLRLGLSCLQKAILFFSIQ